MNILITSEELVSLETVSLSVLGPLSVPTVRVPPFFPVASSPRYAANELITNKERKSVTRTFLINLHLPFIYQVASNLVV